MKTNIVLKVYKPSEPRKFQGKIRYDDKVKQNPLRVKCTACTDFVQVAQSHNEAGEALCDWLFSKHSAMMLNSFIEQMERRGLVVLRDGDKDWARIVNARREAERKLREDKLNG